MLGFASEESPDTHMLNAWCPVSGSSEMWLDHKGPNLMKLELNGFFRECAEELGQCGCASEGYILSQLFLSLPLGAGR